MSYFRKYLKLGTSPTPQLSRSRFRKLIASLKCPISMFGLPSRSAMVRATFRISVGKDTLIVPFFFRKKYSKFLPTYSAYCYFFVHQGLKQPCKVNTFFVTIWHNIVFDNDNFLERIINSFQGCLSLRMPSYLFPFEIHCRITIFLEQRVACPIFLESTVALLASIKRPCAGHCLCNVQRYLP